MSAAAQLKASARPFTLQRLDGLLKLDGVTWRHDIDLSLGASLQMARFEHERGVSATYYVMARSPYYNPFSHRACQVIDEIVKLGHTLGVHCDLNLQRDDAITSHDAGCFAELEHQMLDDHFPVSRALSFHCPPTAVLWHHIPGFQSAYAPQWQGRYFADSRGAFLYGDPEDSQTRPLQVNLHPEHWFPSDDDHAAFWR